MGLPWCTWLVMAGACCLSNGSAYNVERIAEETANFELEFLPGAETDRFINANKDKHPLDSMYNVRSIETTKAPDNGSSPMDSWSVVWYVASFGGLVVFFLIVSCSEWCCRRAIRNHQNCNRNTTSSTSASVPDTPPPSYDHFAPPSYESICLGRNQRGEKNEYDIYVVPVHTFGALVQSRAEDAPPSYISASGGTFVPALTRLESNRVT